MIKPNLEILSDQDLDIVLGFLRGGLRAPDLTIAPDGRPYLLRWYLVPRNDLANCYLHVQLADDPERPMHDHPWDNQSTILAGGYRELYSRVPSNSLRDAERCLAPGDTVQRRAEEAHRLLLAPGAVYSISLFTTGRHRRDWGFWYEEPEFGKRKWISQQEVIVSLPDGRSIFKDRTHGAARNE